MTELVCLMSIVQRVAKRALDVPRTPGVGELASTRGIAARQLGHVRATRAGCWRDEGAAGASDVLCSRGVHQQTPAPLAHDLCLHMLLLVPLLAVREACGVRGVRFPVVSLSAPHTSSRRHLDEKSKRVPRRAT